MNVSKELNSPNAGVIHTTKGDLDISLLDRIEGVQETDNEKISFAEFRLKGQSEIIRRDVHMELKKSVFSSAVSAEF